MLPQGNFFTERYRVPLLTLYGGMPHPIDLQKQILLSLIDRLELNGRFDLGERGSLILACLFGNGCIAIGSALGDVANSQNVVDGRHLLFGWRVDVFLFGLAARLLRVVFKIISFAIENAHVIIIELLFCMLMAMGDALLLLATSIHIFSF